jgi:glycerophosphoryl diester phosphodiesterase
VPLAFFLIFNSLIWLRRIAKRGFTVRHVLTALILLLVPLSASGGSKRAFFDPVQPPRAVQIMTHGGMSMLAPENSLPAILASATDYVEWARVDVRLSKDGQHVVIHDETIDRTSDHRGKVADFTLDELKQFDAGSWFAPRFKEIRLLTLPELLTAARGKVNLCLDCKQVDPELLVRQILTAGMERQLTVSGPAEILAKLTASAKGKIATTANYQPGTTTLAALVKDADPAMVEVDAKDVTADLCKTLHSQEIRVLARCLGEKWDNPSVWRKMFDAGIDIVQTKDPVSVRFAEVRSRIPKFPVKISYHRGACRYAPENTIASIEKAAALGADYIEIDIRPTLDGKYVLLHDGTLDRTTNGKGPIRKMNFEDVRKLSAGAWFGRPFADLRVPALSEGLTAMGKQSHGYLDAKDITPDDLLDVMRKHDLVERSVVYQSSRYLEKLKALDPKVRALPPLRRTDQFEQVAAIKPYGFDVNWSILSRELIEKSHKAGIKVFSDSLAEQHEKIEQYQQAIGWGIDVIQTNHPLRVLRAIELLEKK